MTTAFQLSLPGFDGSLAELPALVARNRLSLDDLPLAQIPLQFLDSRAAAIDLEEAGEVLAAAASLLLLKSAHLLAEPVSPEEDAEDRHVSRKADGLVDLAAALRAHEAAETLASPGRLDLVPRAAAPRPAATLGQAMLTVLGRAGDVGRAAIPRFLRLDLAVGGLLGRLRSGYVNLNSALRGRSRRDVVVYFLAALELSRRGDAQLRQDGLYGEIVLVAQDEAVERRAG